MVRILLHTYLLFAFFHCITRYVAVTASERHQRRTPRIAIVGSGMAGASVAWRLKHDIELEIDTTVFEADQRIGGRLDETIVHGQFEDGVTEKLVELGGTMGIDANRYFVEATDLLNLTRKISPDPSFGVFDGENYVMTSETPLWGKAWRYGWSPYFQNKLTRSIVKKFLNIYDLQDQGITFSSALHLWKGLGIADLLEVSLSEHLRESTKVFGMHTINRAYIDEVVAGQVRVNYNQNPHHMAALAGHIGLAPDATAFKVAEGTSRIPEGLIELSGATVKLNSTVKHISRHGSVWEVLVDGGCSEHFDMVIVAAPLSGANISFSGLEVMRAAHSIRSLGKAGNVNSLDSVEPTGCIEGEKKECMFAERDSKNLQCSQEAGSYVPEVLWLDGTPGVGDKGACCLLCLTCVNGEYVSTQLCGKTDECDTDTGDSEATLTLGHSIPGKEIENIEYQTVYTTYVRGNASPKFFKACKHGSKHDTCKGPSITPDIILTSENSNAAFSCVGTFWKPEEGSRNNDSPRLSKLFSTSPLSEEQLKEMFDEPKVYAEKFWKAYPVFTPPETQEGRMQLSPGLYYTEALEAGASCVEIAAVAGRNVAMLVEKELRERGQVDIS